MIALLKYLKDTITGVHARSYLEEAPEDLSGTRPAFPYVVYSLPTSNEVEHREDFILEINLWDYGADTTALEELTQNMDDALNRKHYLATGLLVVIYRINRMMIPDPDPAIRRRELRYQVKTYMI